MKRYSLILAMLAVLLALSACAPARPAANQPETDALIQSLVEQTMAQQQAQAPATVSVPTQAIPQTGATPITIEPASPVPAENTGSTATVNTDGLNLRLGPGLNYRIRSVLPAGQSLEILGRSNNGDWIEVRLADGRGGWVYRSYLDTSLDLAALPVHEAAGGSVNEPSSSSVTPAAPSRYSLSMTIADNQAVVYLAKFSADKDVTVTLSAGGKHMTVAGGKTDSSGAKTFAFEMPRNWPDGSRLTESSLTLMVRANDGSDSRSASISYYSGL